MHDKVFGLLALHIEELEAQDKTGNMRLKGEKREEICRQKEDVTASWMIDGLMPIDQFQEKSSSATQPKQQQ